MANQRAEDKAILNVWVNKEFREWLIKHAKEHHTNVSEVLRVALWQYYQRGGKYDETHGTS